MSSVPGTALVTGGAGFIGSHIVDRFLAEGWEVRVLDDFSSGHEENLAHVRDRIHLHRADIRDESALREAMAGADVVLHQAAIGSVPRSVEEPILTNQVNLDATLGLLETARQLGVSRVTFAGSCAVYGDDPEMPKRESLPACLVSPYALQKYAAERYCRLYAECFGLETVVLRYFNVYGPRQDPRGYYAAVIPLFVSAALDGKPVCVFGDGEQTRDFVFVGDVVEANWRAATTPGMSGRVFNVAQGRSTSVNELVRRIGDCAGRALAVRHEPPRPGDIRHSSADVSALSEALAWRPATALEAGLERTWEAFRAAHHEETP